MCEVPAVKRGQHSAGLPRLKKRSEFLAAARGRRFHSERMSVQWIDRAQQSQTARPIHDSDALGRDVVNAPGRACLSADPVAAARRTGEHSGPRFGLTVTKKIGNSVERNRIRRRLREAIRLLRPEWPATALDVVVVARRGVLSAPFEMLAVDLKRAIATFSTTRKRPDRPSVTRPDNATDRS